MDERSHLLAADEPPRHAASSSSWTTQYDAAAPLQRDDDDSRQSYNDSNSQESGCIHGLTRRRPCHGNSSRSRRHFFTSLPSTAVFGILLLSCSLAGIAVLARSRRPAGDYSSKDNLTARRQAELYDLWQEWKQQKPVAHFVAKDGGSDSSSSRHKEHRHESVQRQSTGVAEDTKAVNNMVNATDKDADHVDTTRPNGEPENKSSSSGLTAAASPSITTTHQPESSIIETTKQWLDQESQTVQQEAPQVWQQLQKSIHSAPSAMQRSWESLVHQTHAIWSNTAAAVSSHSQNSISSSEVDDEHPHWWQASVDSEEAWRNHLMHHLRHFGKHIQTWWSSDAHATQEHLQLQFQTWYQQANEAERLWWTDTIQAYHSFSSAAGNQTDVWWDLTKHAAHDDWNLAAQKTLESANCTKYHAAQALNYSQAEFYRDWNWTQHEATKEWNATSNYAADKEAEWWSATRAWFENHYASPQETRFVFYNASPLLYLNSSLAYQLLVSNGNYGWLDYSHDFFALQRGWDVQLNQGYCGVASVAAILNSLTGASLTMDEIFDPYPYATQPSVLNNSCVNNKVVRYDDDYNGVLSLPGGLTMSQVARIFQCHLSESSWKTTYRQVDDDVSVDQVRAELIHALTDPNARAMVNFDRKALYQDGYGHMSPIASYSAAQDAFLILDVAKYKYPPVWVPTVRLFAAMHTMDKCGDWDYPRAQLDLSDRHRHPKTKNDMHKALRLLNCRPTYRGYIIVKSLLRSSPSER